MTTKFAKLTRRGGHTYVMINPDQVAAIEPLDGESAVVHLATGAQYDVNGSADGIANRLGQILDPNSPVSVWEKV